MLGGKENELYDWVRGNTTEIWNLQVQVKELGKTLKVALQTLSRMQDREIEDLKKRLKEVSE